MAGGLISLVADDIRRQRQSVYRADGHKVPSFFPTYKKECEKWSVAPRPILQSDRNKECPVMLEKIQKDESYCICNGCRYLLSKTALIQMSNSAPCPMCRVPFQNQTMYINGSIICTRHHSVKKKNSKKNRKKRARWDEI